MPNLELSAGSPPQTEGDAIPRDDNSARRHAGTARENLGQ